ncbi:MAG: SDR family oxidoreductase [Myxococcales bacterium]|nr:SDR family oxidoreductase [Myxococcales bacterium]
MSHPRERFRRAVITGASSGIGEAFARALAASGSDLLLVARREDRLQALCRSLSQAHGVRAEAVRADLARRDEVERLAEALAAQRDVDLLVNNAGFGILGGFCSADYGRQLDMVEVHDVAAMRLCRAVLPNMQENRRGAIVNMASIAAFIPMPKNAVYCASKAFLVAFSRVLALEAHRFGVRVQALCPGFTRSEFHDEPSLSRTAQRLVPSFLWMSAEAVVRESLDLLDRDRVVCIPGRLNRWMVLLANTPLGRRARQLAADREMLRDG